MTRTAEADRKDVMNATIGTKVFYTGNMANPATEGVVVVEIRGNHLGIDFVEGGLAFLPAAMLVEPTDRTLTHCNNLFPMASYRAVREARIAAYAAAVEGASK